MQDVYADLSNNLLVHVMVPALGLRSKQWTVVSWARSQTARESFLDAKYVYRCYTPTNRIDMHMLPYLTSMHHPCKVISACIFSVRETSTPQSSL